MSSKRLLLIALLLILLSGAIAGLVVLRVQFNEDYANVKTSIEERELYVIATYRALTPQP